MSKTIPSGLAAHYALSNTTLCACLKLQRADGAVLGLTSLDVPVTVSGLTYLPGFDLSDLVSQAGLAVDNLELQILEADNVLTVADLLAGRWNGAAFTVFEVNYLSPTDGINLLKRGTTGDAQVKRGVWTVEFRGLKQALQQPLGEVTSKTCRYRLGDSRCTVNLAPHTFACTVTAVTSPQVFTDSARTQLAEWFVEGSVTFLTGPNAGYSQKVKVFAAGQFTLALPMPFAVGLGDTFTAITGCQKRHERTGANPSGVSDCIDKFSNILNFGGEPHLPGVDVLTSLPNT